MISAQVALIIVVAPLVVQFFVASIVRTAILLLAWFTVWATFAGAHAPEIEFRSRFKFGT